MRASPAFQVSVTRFGVWRAAIFALLAISAAVLIAWLVSRDPSTSPAWRFAIGTAGALLLLGGASLGRIAPMSLRWDGQQWHLGRVASAGDEAHAGTLAVVLDLGAWMLLRFECEGTSRRHRIHWLPIQRRGLEARWHALRCAVYWSRPVSGTDAGTNPALANDSKNERP